MKQKLNLDWLIAALIRAARTIAQTALGMFSVGLAISEINWTYVISVSIVAGIFSILTSVATGLPEVTTEGTLKIDSISNASVDAYRLDLDKDAESLKGLKFVTLKVEPNAILPPKLE